MAGEVQLTAEVAATEPRFKGAKAAGFIDICLLRELVSEEIFAKFEKQNRCRGWRHYSKNYSPQRTQRSQRI